MAWGGGLLVPSGDKRHPHSGKARLPAKVGVAGACGPSVAAHLSAVTRPCGILRVPPLAHGGTGSSGLMQTVRAPPLRPEEVSKFIAKVKAHRSGRGPVSLQSSNLPERWVQPSGARGQPVTCHRHCFWRGRAGHPRDGPGPGGRPLQIFPGTIFKVRSVADNRASETANYGAFGSCQESKS